jgi:hypothetical protein
MPEECGHWPRSDKYRQTARVSCRLVPAIVLLLVVARAPAARAGDRWEAFDPLVPPPGLGVVAVDVTAFASRLVFDDAGVAAPAPGFSTLAVEAQAQLGIGEGLALSAAVPWRAVGVVDEGAAPTTVAGVADARVGLRLVALTLDEVLPPSTAAPSTALADARAAASAQLNVVAEAKLPLVGRAASLSPWSPRLGDGQVDLTVSGELAARLPLGGALSWRTGYRLRTDGVSDAVVGRGAISVDVLGGRLAPAALLDFVWSLDPATDRKGVAVEDVGAGAAALGAACRARVPELDPGLALDVGAALSSRGRHALTGLHLSLGVAYAF